MHLDHLLFSRHLDDDEEVIAIIHKHWLLGVRALLWPTVSFVLSWVLLYYVPFIVMFYGVSLWSVLCIVWWLLNFFDYYLDAWIITDQGVIDLEWHGWFHRASSRILYSDIQGVSYEIFGILGTLLRFGELSIEKISTGDTVSLEYVKDPRKVEACILKNMEQYLHSKNIKDARRVQELLAEIVTTHIQLDDADGEDDEEGIED